MLRTDRRPPAVAGTFYPGEPRALRAAVDAFLADAPAAAPALGVVSPHAGYIYSGPVAGKVLGGTTVTGDVIVLCPNHTGRGARAGVWARGAWETPVGDVRVAEGLADALLAASPLLTPDALCHAAEHSLEVQLPFLVARRPDVRIVPVCLAGLSYDECDALGRALAGVLAARGRPTLIVASSDMNHYLPDDVTRRRDRLALDQLLALDARGLFETVEREDLSMCGFIPATVMLTAARALGAKTAELVAYDTSATASGDTRRVVGYAGIRVA